MASVLGILLIPLLLLAPVSTNQDAREETQELKLQMAEVLEELQHQKTLISELQVCSSVLGLFLK